MRLKYLNLKHWLLATAAAALGMNISCDTPVEYGTPEAKYHVMGTVSAPDGSPVPDIEVSRSWGVQASSRQPFDTTDAQGKFRTTLRSFPRESIQLSFTDIDSASNGSYLDTTVQVSTRDVPLSNDDGRWNYGEGTVDVDVTLTPKS